MAQTAIIDLSTLKSYLNISDSDATQDVFLSTLITSVQDFVERYTKRKFGYGDSGDSASIDYSNTDNISVRSTSLSGNILTLTTVGPMPWTIGQNVSLFGFSTTSYNGVFVVDGVTSPTQLSVDISTQTGTLSATNQAVSALATGGYIGNAVNNYAYMTQDQYDGFPGRIIWLRNMDIRSIDTIYLGLRNIAQPALLDHTNYVWRDDGRIILGGSYFNSINSAIYGEGGNTSFYGTIASGYQTITISYWYGYIDVPADIVLAALDICAVMFNARRSGGLQEERAGDYWVRFDVTLRKRLAGQPDILAILDRWQRKTVFA